jgi:hypothetical protein
LVRLRLPQPRLPQLRLQGPGEHPPHGWSSKTRNIRCLRCTTCGHHFSERAGTTLFRTQLPADKALAIAQHLAEGNGMRPTSRLTGVSLNTVLRFARRAGDHARQFHEQMVRHVEVHQVQVDEAWAFVGKKRQAL